MNIQITPITRPILALLNIGLYVMMFTACSTLPKQLDSQRQDDGEYFVRKVEVNQNYSRALISFGLHDNNSWETRSRPTAIHNKDAVSYGDLLRVTIEGMGDMNGLYQINQSGEIDLPIPHSLPVYGKSRREIISLLSQELVRLEWFHADYVRVDVSVVRTAPANILISGAVFKPGRTSINNTPSSKQEDKVQQFSGTYSTARQLLAALQAAGGIRPDADLSNIFLMRDAHVIHVDLSSVIDNQQFSNVPALIEGDHILVLSTGSENAQLITPSQVTPPGMRLFMSNLIAPSLSNAQGAVGSDSTRLPYGSSLLDAAISANCVGGTQSANASRSVLLVTRNHGSKHQIVVNRSIDQLLANSSDHSVNPFVMPNDAVACFDSKFTNFRDVARGIGEAISPLILGGLL